MHLRIILDNRLSFEEHVLSDLALIMVTLFMNQVIIYSQAYNRICPMSFNHRCNKGYFKRKALWWTRSYVLSTPPLIQKVMLLLQILQKWTSSVSFQYPIFSFLLVALTNFSYNTRNAENILALKIKRIFFKN